MNTTQIFNLIPDSTMIKQVLKDLGEISQIND